MEILKNPKMLNEFDDETATIVIRLALEEIDGLLDEGRRSRLNSRQPEEAQGADISDAEATLVRQRGELQRQLRRIAARASGGGAAISSSSIGRVTGPAHSGQGQRLGEASSISTPTSQRRPDENPSNGESSRSAATMKSPETKPGPSNTTKKPLDTAQKRPCNACTEQFSLLNLVELPCGHHYCGTCLTEMFRAATADESRYPPRCCEPISLDQVQNFVDWKVKGDYLENKVEWDTKDRTYCSNKNCLAFIRPENIYGKQATCQKCRKRTCTQCKEPEHNRNIRCGETEALQKALLLMERSGWKRCQVCGTGIERMYGCNRML